MHKLIELFEPVQRPRSKESPLPRSPVRQRFDAERNETPSPEGRDEFFCRGSYVHREPLEYHATSSRDRLMVGDRTYALLHDPLSPEHAAFPRSSYSPAFYPHETMPSDPYYMQSRRSMSHWEHSSPFRRRESYVDDRGYMERVTVNRAVGSPLHDRPSPPLLSYAARERAGEEYERPRYWNRERETAYERRDVEEYGHRNDKRLSNSHTSLVSWDRSGRWHPRIDEASPPVSSRYNYGASFYRR